PTLMSEHHSLHHQRPLRTKRACQRHKVSCNAPRTIQRHREKYPPQTVTRSSKHLPERDGPVSSWWEIWFHQRIAGNQCGISQALVGYYFLPFPEASESFATLSFSVLTSPFSSAIRVSFSTTADNWIFRFSISESFRVITPSI